MTIKKNLCNLLGSYFLNFEPNDNIVKDALTSRAKNYEVGDYFLLLFLFENNFGINYTV